MLLHSYMDALNVRERAASGDAPAGGGDLEKQFKSAKARMYPTNNGDKPPSKGITGRLPGNGDKSQPDAVKGIAPAHPMAAEPTISIPQIWMVPPDIKTKLADPNVEPKFNVPDVTASMGTPSNFSLFPNGNPSPQDVDQHSIGDCFFDGTLGSLAAQNPDFVKNMVHDNGDGTYTVHLFAPNGAPVDVTVNNQVPVLSDGSLAGVGGPNNQANWASIVEKAFAKYNDVFHVTGEPSEKGYAALNDGGSNNRFYFTLTGVTATAISNSYYSTPEQQDFLARTMQQAIKDGKTVFTGSPKEQALPGGAHVVGPHVYSVVDVNQDANGNWYVDVRNPWGGTPGVNNPSNTDDGMIRMSMSDYVKYMDHTNIGDKPIAASGNNSLTSDSNKIPLGADMSPITVNRVTDIIVPDRPLYDDTATVTVDGYTISYSQKYSIGSNSLTITDPSGKDITPPGMANGSDGSFKLPDGAVVTVSGGGTVFSVTDNLGITEQVNFKGAGENGSYDITQLATTPATTS